MDNQSNFMVVDLATKEELSKISEDDLGEVAIDKEKNRIIHKCQANNSTWETYQFLSQKEKIYTLSAQREKDILTLAARHIIEQALADVVALQNDADHLSLLELLE